MFAWQFFYEKHMSQDPKQSSAPYSYLWVEQKQLRSTISFPVACLGKVMNNQQFAKP